MLNDQKEKGRGRRSQKRPHGQWGEAHVRWEWEGRDSKQQVRSGPADWQVGKTGRRGGGEAVRGGGDLRTPPGARATGQGPRATGQPLGREVRKSGCVNRSFYSLEGPLIPNKIQARVPGGASAGVACGPDRGRDTRAHSRRTGPKGSPSPFLSVPVLRRL